MLVRVIDSFIKVSFRLLATNPFPSQPSPDRMTQEELQTFDVRLSLNAAVMSDTAPPSLYGSETFQRRRVKGCPALQTKAYKNLLGGGEHIAQRTEWFLLNLAILVIFFLKGSQRIPLLLRPM